MNDRFRRLAARLWGRGQPGLTHEEPPRSSFDDLARDLAQGLSRREALWRFGTGVAGALLASLGLPAAATPTNCPPGTTPCGTTCCNNANGLACCASASQCLGDGFTCCPSTANPRQICGPGSVCTNGKCVPCGAGTRFCSSVGTGVCCAASHEFCCGGKCCPNGGTCHNGTCVPPSTCGPTGFVCGGPPVSCGADCSCVDTIEGLRACTDNFGCDEACTTSADCVAKHGPGFICQAPGAGCCGQVCIAPCGAALRSAPTRGGTSNVG